MSYVVVASELLTATAVDLSALGSSLNAANFAAAASTTAVAAAGMDEVSTAIASLFLDTPRSIRSWAVRRRSFTRNSSTR